MSDLKSVPLKAPGRGRGILDAMKNRYLLRLLVDKTRSATAARCWVFCGPTLSRVCSSWCSTLPWVFFLGLERGMHNYAVYLFSGMIAINFFSEGFGNGARAMVVNSALIRKIYLPRELFSLFTVWVVWCICAADCGHAPGVLCGGLASVLVGF